MFKYVTTTVNRSAQPHKYTGMGWGEQLGTGKMSLEELPPLQEEKSEITNLNNDRRC